MCKVFQAKSYFQVVSLETDGHLSSTSAKFQTRLLRNQSWSLRGSSAFSDTSRGRVEAQRQDRDRGSASVWAGEMKNPQNNCYEMKRI